MLKKMKFVYISRCSYQCVIRNVSKYMAFIIKNLTTLMCIMQGGGKRLPNYHLVGENCVLVCENLFGLPDLIGENICLLKIHVA